MGTDNNRPKRVPSSDSSKRKTPGRASDPSTASTTGWSGFGLPVAFGPNPSAKTSGKAPTSTGPGNKRTSGYTDTPQANTTPNTGKVPSAGRTEDPVGGGRHTGAVYTPEERGIEVNDPVKTIKRINPPA